MKIIDSKFFDLKNFLIGLFQNKLDVVRQNSYILSHIDFFILLSIFATLFVTTFGQTNLIGLVSLSVPILVIIKMLITKGEKVEFTRSNFYLLIYVSICFISNFTSSMIPQSLFGFMKTLVYFMFFLAVCQFLKNKKQFILPILFFIGILVSFESFVALFQNSIGVENIATWQDTSYVNPEDILHRVYGTLKPYNPNLFAAYLIAGFPAVFTFFAICVKKAKLKTSLITLGLTLVSMFAIFMSGCRGAYVALFAMLCTIALASFQIVFNDLNNEKLKKLWKYLFGGAVACVIGFLAVNQNILHRIMSIFILRGDSSTSFRMNVYNSAIQMFQDNFLCGIGVGNKVFREIYGLYMLSGFDALSCYCVFLEILVESGIFALIFYLMFLFSLLIASIRHFLQSRDYNYKVLLLVCFISVVGVMVHGLVDTVYFRPQIQFVFWTMVAILTTLVRKEQA